MVTATAAPMCFHLRRYMQQRPAAQPMGHGGKMTSERVLSPLLAGIGHYHRRNRPLLSRCGVRFRPEADIDALNDYEARAEML